mgnify:CR=1 FL=1
MRVFERQTEQRRCVCVYIKKETKARPDDAGDTYRYLPVYRAWRCVILTREKPGTPWATIRSCPAMHLYASMRRTVGALNNVYPARLVPGFPPPGHSQANRLASMGDRGIAGIGSQRANVTGRKMATALLRAACSTVSKLGHASHSRPTSQCWKRGQGCGRRVICRTRWLHGVELAGVGCGALACG